MDKSEAFLIWATIDYCRFETEMVVSISNCVNQRKQGPYLSNSLRVAFVFLDSFGLNVDQDRRNMHWFVAG